LQERPASLSDAAIHLAANRALFWHLQAKPPSISGPINAPNIANVPLEAAALAAGEAAMPADVENQLLMQDTDGQIMPVASPSLAHGHFICSHCLPGPAATRLDGATANALERSSSCEVCVEGEQDERVHEHDAIAE
jgi:hypothetical protein